MVLGQLLIIITWRWPRDPIILRPALLCVSSHPMTPLNYPYYFNNSIGVAWGWWVGLHVSLSSVETHVGVNFTAIGPLSPCIEHMLCRLFVWVWTCNVIGQPASALIKASLLLNPGEKTNGFIVEYYGPLFPGGNNWVSVWSGWRAGLVISYPVINHAQWKHYASIDTLALHLLVALWCDV